MGAGQELLVKELCLLLMCFKDDTIHRLTACEKTKADQVSFTDID